MDTELESLATHPALVDVIIPVYKGVAETRRCLESVLAFPQDTAREIVVVDDCGPEPALSAWLRDLAEAGAITLLVNPVNTGFVNAVNRGMILHPDRDVVLLNSDTEVHGDWLDRLRRCAYSAPRVGTVTPFTNNGAICGYPRFNHTNALPAGWPLAALDCAFAEVNAGLSVELPTAVGFCMYIRRNCLNEVGYFDARVFQRGYGEENEFCLRATEVGFEHLLCAEVFVYHQGSVSFGEETKALCAEAEGKLLERYPNYLQVIGDYCNLDPARFLRRRVDLFRLAQSPRPRVLFITHNWGGGTEKHVRDLAELLEPDFEVMILRPTGPDGVSVEWARGGEEWSGYFSLPQAYSKLLDYLKLLAISRLHVHHIIGMNRQILGLLEDLALPYDFTLHDYYPICPQYTLSLADGRYCGEPDVEGCNACLAERPALWGLDIVTWRESFAKLLNGAERVIVASEDVRSRMRRYIPDARYVRLPHPEPALSISVLHGPPCDELKILVIGRLSPAKGLYRLEACAIDAQKRGLPLYFRVIGPADWPVRQEPELPLSFSGAYDDADLPLLIGRERPDAIFFPAQWPETYSYTLSYALATGLPIIAPRLGALSERLADYPKARLVAWDAPAAECNDVFVSLLERSGGLPTAAMAVQVQAVADLSMKDHQDSRVDASHDA
ncbi:MAG: glycosyltransferase [Candidatus Competibacter sp.]